MSDEQKFDAVRAALPSLAAGMQLNAGSVGPLPAEVSAVMTELAEYERTIGRSQHDHYLETLDRMNEARAGVAAVLGAELGDVALTHATTDGMNLAVWGIDWRPGDVAVTSSHEHAGGIGPLYSIRERLGVDVRIADIGDGGDDEVTMRALDRAITPGTRLVAISHVLWSTGAVLPIRRIAELAHERGAILAVDGAQAAGAIPFTVTDLGADAYALPAQKWLLGPEGMGALWVSSAAVDRLRPSFAGHFGLETYDSRGTAAWFADARRFESSDYHRPSIAGFARALSWLSMYVGLDYVWSRGPTMARRAADALAAIDGVELLTPRHQMATLVTFRIRGWDAEAALDELATRTSAIARTVMSLDAIRISVGFFTSEAEIGRFVDGVRLLAAHDPGSLPPRRTLPIFRPA